MTNQLAVRVSSKAGSFGARIETTDGRDLSHLVSGVELSIMPGDITRADITLLMAEVEVDGVARMIGANGREIRRIEYADGGVDDFSA